MRFIIFAAIILSSFAAQATVKSTRHVKGRVIHQKRTFHNPVACPPPVVPSYNGRIINGVVIIEDSGPRCIPDDSSVRANIGKPSYNGRILNGVVSEAR